jgi:hypothetical protein
MRDQVISELHPRSWSSRKSHWISFSSWSKGEVLYERETPSGKVWNGFGEKETKT